MISGFRWIYIVTLCHWCQRGRDEYKRGACSQGGMSCCHQWQRGRLLMKLSLMPTWTCSSPTGCHWYHQVPLAVPWTPYKVGLSLRTLIVSDCALKHLVPSWQGPCTQKDRSWSYHLVEDLEDGPDTLMENWEALDGLKKNKWPIMWSFMLWWSHRTLGEGLATPQEVAWWIVTPGG